jgi:hypothetical protein
MPPIVAADHERRVEHERRLKHERALSRPEAPVHIRESV